MPKRHTIFAADCYYHIYNRCVGHELMFRSEENYQYLLRLLNRYLNEFNVSVIVYCLMPNHYHFLLRQNGEDSISDMMQRLFNTYTKAFNKQHNRSGTLFESRFKSICILTQAYLLHLCRYIHRNPIDMKRPLVTQLEDWPYSNYLEWVGKHKGLLVDRRFIDEHAPDAENYKEFVMDYPSLKMRQRLDQYLFNE